MHRARSRTRPARLLRVGVISTFAVLAALLLALPAAALSARTPHDTRTLTDIQVSALVGLPPEPWKAVDAGHMKHLLVERVSGTPGNKKVQTYLTKVFTKLGWHVETDTFTATTPNGDVEFTNLIYTFDPGAPRKLVLSAHFDSKWFASGGFIGATDSAAPVGFLLDTAEALTPLLKARAERIKAGSPLLTANVDESEAAETTLQIILFDGEEAFHTWTDEDSVYGSRHLASQWENTYLAPDHALQRRRQSPTPNILDTINVLVLLDLLGAPKPVLQSHFRATDWLFEALSNADKRVRAASLVNSTDEWFSPEHGWGGMGDDHVPFLTRGVPILHLISAPFPHVWHTMADDASALDLEVCRRWNAIMRVFTAEYLHLSPDDGKVTRRKRDEENRSDEL
ncbi:uncharacterized protein CcaverHIS019_0212420 [Cutaneotrichosporon cavernicola]|uniref:Peptide hydrolase n=1 Tax=Cutaneotrichosporon cavernicola TaxID=279322 RepID=A0AA48IA29_9TREE|nr:uncharacterized protein CcaverHIS019_0212420 [Cutaneotrichosporon cavernicola]BEI89880.1 hypothetical protein CcaverHIS019_0212420 [Cutaneotrichosporon cavernicola]BEI97651.1 hypothetical protein CcaverHIS631_0212400 [Cutaneotrichosporon cavernicola]BEJ05428.1 hypothetical protein CcaverHIS641_0212450 [Cutaneotrichosporon cavernicola]